MYFYLRLNKRLSMQSRRRWFETPSRYLWRHCNDFSNCRGQNHSQETKFQLILNPWINLIWVDKAGPDCLITDRILNESQAAKRSALIWQWQWQWNDFIAMMLHNFHSVYKTTHMQPIQHFLMLRKQVQCTPFWEKLVTFLHGNEGRKPWLMGPNLYFTIDSCQKRVQGNK